jgi:hypothetical protein
MNISALPFERLTGMSAQLQFRLSCRNEYIRIVIHKADRNVGATVLPTFLSE